MNRRCCSTSPELLASTHSGVAAPIPTNIFLWFQVLPGGTRAPVTSKQATGSPEGLATTTGVITPSASLGASRPLVLRTPALGVDTPVVSLGLNSDRTLQVPPLTYAGIHEAGWYRLGPTPGQSGSAIMVGHVNSAAAGQGVFYRLDTLRPGQAIMVNRQDGTVADFRVTALRQYPKGKFPAQQVYGSPGYASLRLVTCGGGFDPSGGHYLDNVVVYATFVGSS
ncbi:MAG: class F sortase [Acidimicrobiales bacterium]